MKFTDLELLELSEIEKREVRFDTHLQLQDHSLVSLGILRDSFQNAVEELEGLSREVCKVKLDEIKNMMGIIERGETLIKIV